MRKSKYGNIKTTGDFEIKNIENLGTNGEETYYRVKWDRCENARYYYFHADYFFWDSVRIYNGHEYVWEYGIQRWGYYNYLDIDTLINKNNLSEEFSIRSNSDSMYIEIQAFDQNYYDFFVNKIKKVGVENAYGYIGSSTTKKKKIYF